MKDQVLNDAVAAGRAALNESEGKALLAAHGIRVPGSVVVGTPEEVTGAIAGMTGPFVAKVMSPDILHKSDAGGVTLDLPDAAAIEAAIRAMSSAPMIAKARCDGWLVEEMVPQGLEVVIGGLRDPQFGQMLMVGLGGIFVEVLQDVAFGLCPISKTDARHMVEGLKGYKILSGVRGQSGVNIDALVELMLKVGGVDGLLMSGADTIAELDLNPVLVTQDAAIAVDARFILGADTVVRARPIPDPELSQTKRLTPLFQPKSVAVLGASTNHTAIANTFIRRMKDYGYKGEIYPIHPKANEVEGLQAYPDLASTPTPIDYAYVAIGADRIPGALAAARGNCRIAQVISSGFAEIEGGQDLENDLVEKAHAGGVRVLGPNCLGTYSPRGGLTFPVGAPKDVGTIGVVSQSGGLSTDIIKRGQWRGLRFSGLVTMGNSCDLTPTDLLEFYFDDPQTRAVGLYIEDIKDGREFFELLRSAKATKPVVILKGGRSSQGRLAAASHTGALAGDDRAWHALTQQTAAVMVPHVNAFLDTLLALQSFTLNPSKPTQTVALFGNGGGSSVLGSDAFAEVDLDVSPFDTQTRKHLDALGFPPGTSVVNPVDTPVRTLQEKDGWVAGEILDIIYEYAKPQAVAMHLNLAAFVGRGDVDPVNNLFSVVEDLQSKHPGKAHFSLALRSDGSAELEDAKRAYKERAREIGVPIYDEIPEMAAALANVAHLERRMAEKL
ncbi:MAG: acetate--CoA ligase family protein [Sulfitobacter sp.]|uniref:acetate--CoA ligase family protein n=1 Tax=Alphaproteobacteria TaxID=28211 RepID=UPI0029427739|nr:acetate--CoA ligase family protein [Sulfitobacter sp. LC.270.F.C4]WOI13418.1 acetate--CoA ligase family protein [Sulfitobacter sp. LC.270.F.C4]